MGFDAIIIGGSYSGLAAAMSLGRSLRKVLVIDSGKPCNRQTPYSHNFITHDGSTPHAIAVVAKQQVLKYPTVNFYDGLATAAVKTPTGFEVTTAAGDVFTAKKLLFTTGIFDQTPTIPGFADCWGITVLHCPYCHGYEIKDKIIGLFANGDLAFEFCKTHSNWSKNLVVFTNGKSTLSQGQVNKLAGKNIEIIEQEINQIVHADGAIKYIVLADGSIKNIDALYAKVDFKQHCELPQQMGCGLNEHGYLAVDECHQTSVPGVFAAGDNTTMFRSVAAAVGSGNKAGIFINKNLIEEEF